MRISLNRLHLNYAFGILSAASSKRAAFPALMCVLMEFSEDTLTLTQTSIDLTIRVKCACGMGGSTESVRLCLPAKKLSAIVGAMGGESLNIEVKGESAVITGGGTRFRLIGLPANQFPSTETFSAKSSFSIEQEKFEKLIRQVRFAQAEDIHRPILQGINFCLTGTKLELAATDGKRLAATSGEVVAGEDGADLNRTLPEKGVNALLHLLSDKGAIRCHITAKRAEFSFDADDKTGLIGEIQFSTVVIEGNFPAWKSVVPKNLDKTFQIERESFAASVNRVGQNAGHINDRDGTVILSFAAGTCTISSENPELGSFFDLIPVSYEGELKWAACPKYLQDALDCTDDEHLEVSFGNELNPCTIRNQAGFLAVIMPRKIA